MTLSEFLRETYVPARLDLKPASVEQLAVTIRLLDRHLGRPTKVAELSTQLIRNFLSVYRNQVAPATVNDKRRHLMALWRCAHDEGYCPNFPGKIATMKEPQRLPEAWTIAEVERLLVACQALPGYMGNIPRRRWWLACLLAVYDTAGRIGSVRSVLTTDFSFAERYFVVRHTADKTQRDRIYWLSDQAVTAISAIYDPQQMRLFPWPYCRQYLWRFFRRQIVERAGLQAPTRGMGLFHKLRRTTLSYCAAHDMALAQQQAGHSDPRLTQRRYVDPRIARTRSAVDVLPRPHFD